MTKENPSQFMHKTLRFLICAFVLSGGALQADAWAQDAMSDRYAAIRAPTEALVGRIGRQRLQADHNALTQERIRVRGQLRQTEYLRLLDPVSGMAAAERALDGRLDRLGTDLRETRALLAEQARARGDLPISGLPPLQSIDPGVTGLETVPAGFSDRTMAEAVVDARAFVDELLRANRSRP